MVIMKAAIGNFKKKEIKLLVFPYVADCWLKCGTCYVLRAHNHRDVLVVLLWYYIMFSFGSNFFPDSTVQLLFIGVNMKVSQRYNIFLSI